MISNLQIRNFRGLKDVCLRKLRRINLLVGGNDTGKTSVLEALVLLLADGSTIEKLPVMFRNNQSGQAQNSPDDRENFWLWLFYDRDYANGIEIIAETEDSKRISIRTHLTASGGNAALTHVPDVTVLERSTSGGQGPAPLILFNPKNFQIVSRSSPEQFRVSRLSTRPSNPVEDAEKYNQIALESEGERKFERIMREVEPRLKRLRYAKLPGTNSPLVFADIGLSRSVPATQMGQAFNRILHIYAEILASKTDVLLVDEIENGIFSESLPLIWKGLFTVCREHDVQIFATTHSRECVMAANMVARELGQDDLSVQRLQFVQGRVEAVRLGPEQLEVAAQMGLEVRS